MNLHPVPLEFSTFVSHFQDVSREGHPSYERFLHSALGALSAPEKAALARYLAGCLDGTHSEDELRKLWSGQGPRETVHPMTRFLEDVQARLG